MTPTQVLPFQEAIQDFKESLLNSARKVEGIAPPDADEWPDLELPERRTVPLVEWKAPLIFYSCFIAGIVSAMFIVHGINPGLLGSVMNVGNVLRSPQPPVNDEAKVPPQTLSRNDKASAPLSPLEIAEMQKLLARVGYNPGPADGIAGKRTQKTLLAWAKDRDVSDPKIDRATLETLRTSSQKGSSTK